jgi:hypothetical protein
MGNESGKLRSTDSGKILTMKGDLQKAITHFEKTHLDDINFEANPLLLMPEKGYKAFVLVTIWQGTSLDSLQSEFGQLLMCVPLTSV